MKIVYDMRTGEIIERTVESRAEGCDPTREPVAITTPEPMLQLEEYCWSNRKAAVPPGFLAGHFDEDSD
ncbi:MAG: hypothetical protein Kow006_13030 [Gammaproteobacteria bacterium]